MRQLNVVAGILLRADGEVLIAERLGDGPFHGMWEFPGGKISAGESPEAALAREISEEIGVGVVGAEPFVNLDHEYPDRRVNIRFYLIRQWAGDPVGKENQKLQWLPISQLGDANLLPADEPVVEALGGLGEP